MDQDKPIFLIQLYGANPQSQMSQAKISLCKIDQVTQYKWYLGKDGYPYAYIQGGRAPLHRFIWLLNTGSWSNHTETGFKLYVDHINRDKLDARDENLRLSTPAQNSYNKSVSKNKLAGSKDKLVISKDKLAGSKDKLVISKDKLAGSKDKLAGSKDKLEIENNPDNTLDSTDAVLTPETLHHIKLTKTGYSVSLTKSGQTSKINKIETLVEAKQIYNMMATELFGEFAVLY